MSKNQSEKNKKNNNRANFENKSTKKYIKICVVPIHVRLRTHFSVSAGVRSDFKTVFRSYQKTVFDPKIKKKRLQPYMPMSTQTPSEVGFSQNQTNKPLK